MMKEEDKLWKKGAFIEGLTPNESHEKMKTLCRDHDDDKNYKCIRCDKDISAHNKDWHGNMCDECFENECFSDDEDDAATNEEIESLKAMLNDFNPDEHSVLELCKENGTGKSMIDESSLEDFIPLLAAIEETILMHYSENNSLKDSDVIESLKNIRDNIFSGNAKFNEMEENIVDIIKINLFLSDYDKRDILLSISKVLSSAKSHRSNGGGRGYLNLISSVLCREKQYE